MKRRAYLTGRITHALSLPRRNRKVIAPGWRTVVSYAELLDARQPSILWLHEPEPLPPSTDLLFPELANEEIRQLHSGQPQPTGIGIAILRNALVSGQSLVGTSSKLYLMAPITPLFVDEYLQKDGPVGDRKLSKKAKRFIPGTSILLTNWNSSTYGHWLLEGMPKLLLLRRVAHELPPFRIGMPHSLPTWILKWIELILPSAKIERYDDSGEYVQCESLLLPTLLTSPEHVPHPELAILLEDITPPTVGVGLEKRRIFVSRIANNPFREMINQTEIEENALEEGLTLVKPETLSIPEQIAQFARADLIVGEFGSAMHNTLFSPTGAQVFCLNWINPLQSYIGRLKRQHVGYLLPSSGTPVTFVLGMTRLGYHIDPRVFRNCLRALDTRR